MKTLIPSLLLLSAFFGETALFCETAGAAEKEAPLWQSDITQARQLARQSNRPLFVVFR